MPLLLMEVTTSDGGLSFVKSIIDSVGAQVNLGLVAGVIGAIITAGVVAVVAWKFARKGYKFVINALSGRSGQI